MAQDVTLNDSRILNAGKWLLESGIQNNTEQDPTVFGGVNAWYNVIAGNYPFIYGEITGYAINSFLSFYDLSQEEKFLTAAKNAAKWIISNRVAPSGLVLNRFNHIKQNEPYFKEWFFIFDQWMIVYGLAELYSVTQELIYLKNAEEIAQFLIQHTVTDEGAFYPIFDQQTQKSLEQDDKWSRQSGGYHAKGLMGLLKLYDLTQNEIYLNVAHRLRAWTLDTQQSTGRFITQDTERSSHLHPYLYTLEGLLYYASHQSCDKTFTAIEKAALWILKYQNDRGGFYSYYMNDEFRPFERADIVAQFLRVSALLIQRGRMHGQAPQLERIAAHLESYQILSGNQQGGFFYGQEETGQLHYCVNAWVTMFASQALLYYDNIRNHQSFDMKFFV